MLSTICVDFDEREIIVNDYTIRLQIWDTAGQEQFRSVTLAYYRDAVGVLIFYDLTKYVSFKNVEFWLREVRPLANENIVKMLIGNKNDLIDKRVVSEREATLFADQQNMSFIETSAKEAYNVEQTFYQLTKEICKRNLLVLTPKTSIVDLDNKNEQNKQKVLLN
ncbi:hypothetical protein M3Y97_00977100 [Aphelenchoides bicaudatus]|nr:hypothetical protein M3Y97_00977100 [Aphelenchoides bicaudatus]